MSTSVPTSRCLIRRLSSGFLVASLICPFASTRGQEPAPAPTSDTDTEPAFEVASVKKSGPMPQGGPFRFDMRPGGTFSVSQIPLVSLITLAYGVQPFQLIGGPGWITTDRFDINAKADDTPAAPPTPGAPNRMQLMLQSLLEDRFSLVVHKETRELPVSYLVVAREDRKLGERLRPSATDCAALFAQRARGSGPPLEPPKPGEAPKCGVMGGIGRISAGGATMATLASMLSNQLSRAVYDRTNLSGFFEFQLEYTPDRMPQLPPGVSLPPGFTLPSPDGPSLLTALQEQLGLKLENTRGAVEVLVIDSVHQPTPD